MPRIQITPMAKIALVALRIYLLLLLTLIGISFYRMFAKNRAPDAKSATNQVSTAAAQPR